MKKITKVFLITIGFGSIPAVLGVLNSKPAAAQFPPPVVPVKVTNTPLPVTGNVNVTGTVTANINSLPNVNATITNSFLSALITNPANNPVLNRDIDRPDNQPFNVVLCSNATPGISFTQQQPCVGAAGDTSLQIIVIPITTSSGQAVKRLVIEYVSGSCGPVAPNSVNAVGLVAGSGLNLVSGTPSNPGQHFFPLTAWNGQLPFVQWAEPVHIYCDPGSTVSLNVNAPSGSVSGCSMFVTGYLTVA